MKLYGKLGVILAGCALSIGISSTWAYYSDTQTVVNPFHTTNSALDMVEEFNPSDTMLPGETVEKKPYFVNKGDMELVLRLQMDTYWADQAGDMRWELDPREVTLHYPEDFEKNWTEINGYYYYCGVLAGQGEEGSRTPYFLDSLTLSSEVSNDGHGLDYSGCQFIVDFNAEAVPADALSVAASGWELAQDTPGAENLEWRDLLPGTDADRN